MRLPPHAAVASLLVAVLGCGEGAPPPVPSGQLLELITPALPPGTEGVPYSAALTARGGSGRGYGWRVVRGVLPAGLELGPAATPTTLLAGTPTEPGVHELTIAVADDAGHVATRTFSLDVGEAEVPLRIATSSLAPALIDQPYAALITAAGGMPGTHRWSIVEGALPAGLTLGALGTPSTSLSGTPTAAGRFAFTVRAQDATGALATRALELVVEAVIAPVPLTLTTTAAARGTAARPYRQVLVARGGSGVGYAWSIAGGALPAGLVLGPTGTPTTSIAGTPTEVGRFAPVVEVTDSAGARAAVALVLDLEAPPAPGIVTPALPGATEAQAYAAPLRALGGSNAGFRWRIVAGALPPGLRLRADGTPDTTLAGTPTAAGRFDFTVEVSDSLGLIGRAPYALEVAPRVVPIEIATTTVAAPARGRPYRAVVDTTPGTGSGRGYAWLVVGGALPPGLVLEPTGAPATAISGTPTAGGTYTATIAVFDADNTSDAQVLRFDVAVPLLITTRALRSAQRGVPHAVSLEAEGGSASGYTWSIASGALPPGLALDARGTPAAAISGTATATGSWTFAVQVSDDAGDRATRLLSLAVVGGLTIETAALPAGTMTLAYTATIAAAGGSGYAWSVSSGQLPPGLALTPSGTPFATLSGTPTAAGRFAFTVTVTDSSGESAHAALVVQVAVRDRWAGWVGDTITDGLAEVFVVGLPGRGLGDPPIAVGPAPPAGGASIVARDNQLSPDGTRLALRGAFRRPDVTELYVVDLRGRTPGPAVRVSADLVAGGDVLDFAWSPDATRLLYAADQDTDEVGELYLVDVAGPLPGAPVRLNGPLAGDGVRSGFDWAPDGRQVAYRAAAVSAGAFELFVVDVGGAVPGPPRVVNGPLTPGGSVDRGWRWAPAGDRLLFQADPDGRGEHPLFRADVSGPIPSPPQRVSSAGVRLRTGASLSADGAWVGYVTEQTSARGDHHELFVVRVDGPAVGAPLRASVAATDAVVIGEVRWSPAAPRLLFGSNAEQPTLFEVFLVDLAAGTPTAPLKIHPAFPDYGTFTFPRPLTLTWSPDGTHAAYFAEVAVDDVFQVQVVDLSGATPGPPLDASPPPAPGLQADAFAFAPDGHALAVRGDLFADGWQEVYVTPLRGSGAGVPRSVTGISPVVGAQVLTMAWADERYLLVRGDLDRRGDEEAYFVDTAAPVFPLASLTRGLVAGGDVSSLLVR